jgi:hypothetical protein
MKVVHTLTTPRNSTVDIVGVMHTACGYGNGSTTRVTGGSPQSTGPTTTTTLLKIQTAEAEGTRGRHE